MKHTLIKKNISKGLYKNELQRIETYMQRRNQKFPYEYAMKALYEFINEEEPFSLASIHFEFIRSLRFLLSLPEIRKEFYKFTKYSDEGIDSELDRFESFFIRLKEKKVLLDLDKLGLLEYPERYQENSEWGGTEPVIDNLNM